MTGRDFVLGVASVVLRLALAQILCNLLIAATGAGLLNVLFYLYAVATLAMFMRRTVASSAVSYTHLDVYKRQMRTSGFRLAKQGRAIARR